MNIVALAPDHADALVEFFGALSERDLTFIKEDVTDPETVRSWAELPGQWIAIDDEGSILGYVTVRRLSGWSDHVGEIRLIVHPGRRRTGAGRALATHALKEALRDGRSKLVVELAADQEYSLAMFSSLGFTGEALLRDHIRDRDGKLRDLVVLAHFVDANWGSLDAIGVTDELGLEGTLA